MQSAFSTLDWLVFASYFLLLALTSVLFSRIKVKDSADYFVGGRSVPFWAAAISLLATSQSAATFLGGPEYSYDKDLTFLGFYISAAVAVVIVVKWLLPKFYAINAVTVYDYLGYRFGEEAKRYAAVMFLVGRLFASGARLYIGALAISMILFLDIEASHVAVSILILMLGALAYAYFGGIRSIILSDIIQAITYTGAAVAVAIFLYMSFDLEFSQLLSLLQEHEKLRVIDTYLSGGFSIWALFSGWLLLNIAAYGLDQDMTQRALSCKNSKEASKSMLMGIVITFPVALLFLFIGLLLYLYYAHPEVSMLQGKPTQEFAGDKITIMMYYILHEMPEGLRGLVTVGAVAAALSSSNSVLSAMASVAVEDLYKPYIAKRGEVDEAHLLKVSRLSVVLFAVALSIMAMLCYYWQHATDLPLLNFALGMMAFAYTGLLGVYATALFTKRGSAKSVLFALIAGFVTVLFLQPYVSGIKIGFAWQMVTGTAVAFMIAAMVAKGNKVPEAKRG